MPVSVRVDNETEEKAALIMDNGKRRVTKESSRDYCSRIVIREGSSSYDLAKDLIGKEGSSRGDLSVRGRGDPQGNALREAE
jgi:hypothetical protein